MKFLRNTLAAAAVSILFSAGCMLFQNIRVPDRVPVANSELPSPQSGDFLQASLRFQPQSPDMALRLEREAGIDRQVWSFPVQQAMSGASSFRSGRQAQLQVAGRQAERTTGPQEAQGTESGTTQGQNGRQARQISPNTNDVILSQHLNRITEQTRRAAWNGHVFYFLSTAVDTPVSGHSGVQFESTEYDDPRRYHLVYALDEHGRGAASFRTEDVEPVRVSDGLPRSLPSQPLQFDVVVTVNGPWILYRDRGGIFARPLVFGGSQPVTGQTGARTTGTGRPGQLSGGRGSFTFGEPRLVSRAELPYGEFQFVARLDDRGAFHVIWTDSRDKNDLWYCRFDPQTGDACRRPVRLSRSTARDPVNLMVRGEEVYVTWIDNRFTRGVWTRHNMAKLFVVKSEDRGASFGPPVSIHPPREESEIAGYSVTMPAPSEGIMIFLGNKMDGHRSIQTGSPLRPAAPRHEDTARWK